MYSGGLCLIHQTVIGQTVSSLSAVPDPEPMGCKDSKPDREDGGPCQYRNGNLTHGHFEMTTEGMEAHLKACKSFRAKRIHMEHVRDLEKVDGTPQNFPLYICRISALPRTPDVLEGPQKSLSQSLLDRITEIQDKKQHAEDQLSRDYTNNLAAQKLLPLPTDTLLSKLEQHKLLEAERERVELLTLDASSWESYVKEQVYQKGEDRLCAAQEANIQVRGRTSRYAQLKSAVGAIYEFRSNTDQTGQQQELSLEAARHCRDALQVWRELTAPEALSKCRKRLISD